MTQTVTEPESDRPFKVEQRGIDIAPDSERHGNPRELFWIWAASLVDIVALGDLAQPALGAR
jgi:NCS1 family nucleobase:cation symporter-1